MVLSWTRLTAFSGTLVACHFIARKYMSSEEDEEDNVSGILSPTLPVAPVFCASGVYLTFRQSKNFVGIASCGILSACAFKFCKNYETDSLEARSGKAVGALASLGVIFYSSYVLSDFYWFIMINGVALTPIVYKYVKKVQKALKSRENEIIAAGERGVEALIDHGPRLLEQYVMNSNLKPEHVAQIIGSVDPELIQSVASKLMGDSEQKSLDRID